MKFLLPLAPFRMLTHLPCASPPLTGPPKGRGANSTGFLSRKGQFHVDPYKRVHFVVPNLEGCEVRLPPAAVLTSAANSSISSKPPIAGSFLALPTRTPTCQFIPPFPAIASALLELALEPKSPFDQPALVIT